MSLFHIQLEQPITDASLASSQVQAVSGSLDAPTGVETPAAPAVDFGWVNDMLHLLEQRLSDLEQSRQRILSEMQMVAVDLAIAATGKLLYEKIERDEFPSAKIIEEIVQQLPTSGELRVALNPKDQQQLEQKLVRVDSVSESDIEESSENQTQQQRQPPREPFHRLKLVGDPAMPRGQFEIDSGEGVFFYDVAAQLADIRRVLMENLDESETERRATGQQGGGVRRFPDRRSVG